MNKKDKLSIIDADGLIFKAAWAYRDAMNIGSVFAVQAEIDRQISALLNITHANYFVGFFGAEDCKNYRYDVATIKPYKGQRISEPWMSYFKPKIKEYFKNKWKFYEVGDIEGDDCLSILFHLLNNDYNITLIYEDKDLKQIPNHTCYNFGKKTLTKISSQEAIKNLWLQVITGDSSDNVPGLPGKGPAAAEQILKDCTTDIEMFEAVKLAYFEVYLTWDLAISHLLEQYLLIKMLDQPKFDFPETIQLQNWTATTKIKKTILDI